MNQRFGRITSNIRQRLAQVNSALRCGVVVTGAVREWWRDCVGDEEVVIFLLSDTTNIDSKWITCLSTKAAIPNPEAVFQHLYKFDPTA
jgi:hypothetical protein